MKTYLVVDFSSSQFLNAVSAYRLKVIGVLDMYSYVIPYVLVLTKYLRIRFNAVWCCILGLAVYDTSLFTMNAILGHIELAMYWSSLSSCANKLLWSPSFLFRFGRIFTFGLRGVMTVLALMSPCLSSTVIWHSFAHKNKFVISCCKNHFSWKSRTQTYFKLFCTVLSKFISPEYVDVIGIFIESIWPWDVAKITPLHSCDTLWFQCDAVPMRIASVASVPHHCHVQNVSPLGSLNFCSIHMFCYAYVHASLMFWLVTGLALIAQGMYLTYFQIRHWCVLPARLYRTIRPGRHPVLLYWYLTSVAINATW